MHSSTRPLFVRWAVMGNACRTAERRALKDLARTTGGHIRTNFAGRHQFIFHGTLDSMNLQESHWLSWTPRGRDPPRWHTHRGRHRRPL